MLNYNETLRKSLKLNDDHNVSFCGDCEPPVIIIPLAVRRREGTTPPHHHYLTRSLRPCFTWKSKALIFVLLG